MPRLALAWLAQDQANVLIRPWPCSDAQPHPSIHIKLRLLLEQYPCHSYGIGPIVTSTLCEYLSHKDVPQQAFRTKMYPLSSLCRVSLWES